MRAARWAKRGPDRENAPGKRQRRTSSDNRKTMNTSAAAPLVDIGPSAAQRLAAGRALRERVPRSSHSAWTAPKDRADPLAILAGTCNGRVSALVPLRNAKMAESPFAFFRGGADIMAADLARTPATGLPVQLCGDAHCLNFGAFATAERRLIFDVTDFDETAPGPWEWDLKRLAVSLVLAARSIKLKEANATIAVIAAARSYRLRMLEFAAATALDIWYARIDAASVVLDANPDSRRHLRQIADSANAHSMRAALEKITVTAGAIRRFRDEPPLLFHPAGDAGSEFAIEGLLESYAEHLAPEVRVLFDRYHLVDHAVKVAGVGSIGTRCSVALMQADIDDALILQIKQASASVLERFTEPSAFANHGERVVRGQRLMQRASDALLGWGTSGTHDFYVRQFSDKKGAVNIAALDGFGLREYAHMCGWTLARAHARSGDAAQIAGYLGKADTFDKALVRFAVLYADQVEQDYASFHAAADAGKIPLPPRASAEPPSPGVRSSSVR
jgi:uncharacterized protein (DUF2252 family)